MPIQLVDRLDESRSVYIEFHDGMLFLGLDAAWDVQGPANMDRDSIMAAVEEYGRVYCLDQWQWSSELKEGQLPEPYHQKMATWLGQNNVSDQLAELEDLLVGNDDISIKIFLSWEIIEKCGQGLPQLHRVANIYSRIKSLHEMNAFAELADLRDALCLKMLSGVVFDLVGILRILAFQRKETVDAMIVSDYVHLDVVERLREAQHLLFESEQTLRLFELLRWEADVSNPSVVSYRRYNFSALYRSFSHDDGDGNAQDSLLIRANNLCEIAYLKWCDAIQLRVKHVKHKSRRLGYIYGLIEIPLNYRPYRKPWLRWGWDLPDKKEEFHVMFGLETYPTEIEPEFHVAIRYDYERGAQCLADAAPMLCRKVYMQLTSQYLDILDKLIAPPEENVCVCGKRKRN